MADQLYIVSPKGVVGTIPSSSEKEALGMGYRPANSDEISEAKLREHAASVPGMLRTFLGQAANEFLLGAPEATLEVAAAGGVDVAKEAKHRKDVLESENPGLAMAGRVVGLGGQLLSTFGTGAIARAGTAAAEKAATFGAGKIGQAVARGAVEGASFSAAANLAPAITQAVVDDPKRAMERYAYSVGLGGLFGAVATPLAEEGVDLVSRVAAKSKNKLSETAYREAVQVAGLTPLQLEKLEKFHGFKIDDIGKYLLDNGLVQFGDNKQAVLTKLGQQMQQTGEKIGGILTAADSTLAEGMRPQIDRIVEGVNKRLDEQAAKYPGQFTAEEVSQMKETATNYVEGLNLKGVVSGEELGKIKTGLQKRLSTAFEKRVVSPEKNALMAVRDEFASQLEGYVAKGEGAGGATLDDYLGLKRDYELQRPLKASLEKQAYRELSPSGSLLEKIKGSPTALLGGLLGFGAGELTGDKLVTLPAAMVGFIVSNRLRHRWGPAFASVLNKAATLEFAMPKLGSLAVPRAASELASSVSAKDFPVYSKVLAETQANPEMVTSRVANFGTDDLQGAAHQTALAAHNFLYEKMPKNPLPNPMNPDEPYKPSRSELASFNRYYAAVYDPASVLRNPTPEGLEALQTIYPALYNDMIQAVASHYAGKGLGHKESEFLSNFLDMPGRKTLQFLQAPKPQPAMPNKGSHKPAGAPDLLMTPTQRIEAR